MQQSYSIIKLSLYGTFTHVFSNADTALYLVASLLVYITPTRKMLYIIVSYCVTIYYKIYPYKIEIN